MKFKRDTKDKRSQFLSTVYTDELLDYLEALCNVEISPTGAGRLDITRGSAILTIRDGSAFAPFRFLQLVDVSTQNTSGVITSAAIRVVNGNVGSDIASNMSAGDVTPLTFSVSGAGSVWAKIVIDTSTGLPTTRLIQAGGSVPASDPPGGTYYYGFGSYSVASKSTNPSNGAYGPIGWTVCDVLQVDPVTKFLTNIGGAA
jgi:hypothetical protein